jgi:hypothetical protein
MPAYPIPVITPVAPVPYSPTPVDIPLSGTSSTPSDGHTITAWLWTLFDWPNFPAAPTAYIENPTTSTPTLKNVTVGGYGIHLKITDSSGQSSHAYWYPTQKQTPPYNFIYPLPSSIASVVMLTEKAGLALVNRGARNWFDAVGGYWDLVEKVDEIYGTSFTGDGRFDHLYEKTLNHGITVHHPVDGQRALFRNMQVKTDDDPGLTLFSAGDSSSDGLIVNSRSAGNGGKRVEVPWAIWSNAIATREVRAGDATDGSLHGDIAVKATGVLTLDPGTGRIEAKNDFRTNAITPIANNDGVQISKRGTCEHDLLAEVIKTTEIWSPGDLKIGPHYGNSAILMNTVNGSISIEANGAGKHLNLISGNGDVSIENYGNNNNISLVSENGYINIEAQGAGRAIVMEAQAIRADGKLAAKIGNSATRGRVFSTIVSKCPEASTTGTSEQTLASFNIPANTFSAEGDQVYVTGILDTADNSNSKTVKILVAGTIVFNYTLTNKLILVPVITITRTASANTFSVLTQVIQRDLATITANETNPITVEIRGHTPVVAGELTLLNYRANFIGE